MCRLSVLASTARLVCWLYWSTCTAHIMHALPLYCSHIACTACTAHMYVQAYGARQYGMLGVVLQRARLICWTACLPIAVLWNFMEPVLNALGQEPQLSHLTAINMRVLIPGLFFGECCDVLLWGWATLFCCGGAVQLQWEWERELVRRVLAGARFSRRGRCGQGSVRGTPAELCKFTEPALAALAKDQQLSHSTAVNMRVLMRVLAGIVHSRPAGPG